MTEMIKEGSTENIGSSVPLPKRKQGKQFTVNGSKKSSRISSFGNLKNAAKLTRIRSVDSMGSNPGGNESERPRIARTRSNVDLIRSVSSGPNIYSRPNKAKSMTNLHLRKARKGKSSADAEFDAQSDQNSDDEQKSMSNKDNEDYEDYEENEDEDDYYVDRRTGSIATDEKKANGEGVSSNTNTSNEENTQVGARDQILEQLKENVAEMKIDSSPHDAADKQFGQESKTSDGDISEGQKNILDQSDDFKEGENSLNMYRMHSVLSQSTGQERQLSNNHVASRQQSSNTVENPQNMEKEESGENASSHNDSNTTVSSSKSGMPYHTNQDSLIFQQSGLTLYNLNTQPSVKNLQLSQLNATNMKATASHPSLQRQESYLSFGVPENLQHRLQMSTIQGNTQHPQKVKSSSPSENSKSRASAEDKEPPEDLNNNKASFEEKTPQNVSLLSKQARSMEYGGNSDNQQSEILDLDLSSYLSSQEPEIESRTQQKLWLQRENVATLNDFEEGTSQTPSQIINQTTRFQYEQLSREFLHIRRHTNPMLGSLQRIYGTCRHESHPSGKKLDVPEPVKTVSKSISKSSLRNSRPATANSMSKSLGLSLKEAELTGGPFTEDLESYNDELLTLWKKSCLHFKEPQAPSLRSGANSSNSFNQGGVALSARYGYQPNTSGQQFSQAFARGNHTSFGNTNLHSNTSGNFNGFGNQVNHFNGLNRSSQYQPTTRAQQQQQQQQQQQLEQQRRHQLQQRQQQQPPLQQQNLHHQLQQSHQQQ